MKCIKNCHVHPPPNTFIRNTPLLSKVTTPHLSTFNCLITKGNVPKIMTWVMGPVHLLSGWVSVCVLTNNMETTFVLLVLLAS